MYQAHNLLKKNIQTHNLKDFVKFTSMSDGLNKISWKYFSEISGLNITQDKYLLGKLSQPKNNFAPIWYFHSLKFGETV